MKVLTFKLAYMGTFNERGAAVRGRKEVVGPAVYKNIAEFNEKFVLRTVKGAALGAD